MSSVFSTGLPTVLLDFSCDGPDVDAVVSDGQVGCYQLTRYLIDHSHRRIGFVGNINRTPSIMDRYSGFLRAMMHEKLPVPEDCVIPDSDVAGRYCDDFAFPDPMPTALVCNNDMLAGRVIEVLQARGLRVPEEVSVVGFDDFVYGDRARPVTTYAVDQQRMAQVTARRLRSRIREGMEGPCAPPWAAGSWNGIRCGIWSRESGAGRKRGQGTCSGGNLPPWGMGNGEWGMRNEEAYSLIVLFLAAACRRYG